MQQFRYIDGAAILKLDQAACIGCGMCEIVCPHRIFQCIDNKATIVDYDACMECGACARNCPVGAIFVNPDDGCGCARYILNSWLAKIFRTKLSPCGG